MQDEGRVCPYCEGKGYTSVEVETPRNTRKAVGDTKAWTRKDCPLCDGTGKLQADPGPNPAKDPG